MCLTQDIQARNRESFRAGEFSWNLGTSINIHLQHEKERPHREKISVGFLMISGETEVNQFA